MARVGDQGGDRRAGLPGGEARAGPQPVEFSEPQAIARFLRELSFRGQELEIILTRANNQPALVCYLPDPCAPI
jgi:catechol 2,3-dioxygenase-like lactoylglutathione lyase family enzyme